MRQDWNWKSMRRKRDDVRPAAARWPARVYGGGAEPDPRFSLANERTFLAWIRTTLALLAAAAAVEAVNLPMPDPVQRLLAAVLATTGLVCVAQAWRGWIRTETALRHRQPLPHSPANLPVVVGITVAALTLLAVLAVSVAS